MSLALQRKKLAALKRIEAHERKLRKLRGTLGGTDQKCIGAFVIFNNEESALRCIEDYK